MPTARIAGDENVRSVCARKLWTNYARFCEIAPLSRGKPAIGRALRWVLGPLRVEATNCIFELDPVGLIDRSILLGREHDALVPRSMRAQLRDGGTLVDVGANIGYFTLAAARLPRTRVIAFEPSCRERARLRRNIALNGLQNVTLHPFGLSDVKCDGPLFIARDGNPGGNTHLRDVLGEHGSERAETCAFHRFVDVVPHAELADVRFVKIDVEGAELAVLRGMEECMSLMHAATFAVEISPAWLERAGGSASAIYQLFERHGFRPLLGPGSTGQYDELFVPG